MAVSFLIYSKIVDIISLLCAGQWRNPLKLINEKIQSLLWKRFQEVCYDGATLDYRLLPRSGELRNRNDHLTEEQFKELYDQFFSRVYRYFLNKGTGSEVSLELSQDTFLRAWRGREEFRGEIPASDWITLVAINVWKNYLREKSSKKRTGRLFFLDHPPSGQEVRDPLPVSADQEQKVIYRESSILIKKEIASLPQKTRVVAALRLFQGLSFREIAKITGSTENTVKSQMSQAKKKLKSSLAQYFTNVEF